MPEFRIFRENLCRKFLHIFEGRSAGKSNMQR
jgi:hypothetical protein